MSLLEVWDVYEHQCARRSDRPASLLPTSEATNAVMDASSQMAARIGVSGTELRAWMQALRRGGWSRANVVLALEHTAEVRE